MEVIYPGLDDQATLTTDLTKLDLTSMERKFIKRYEELPILWKKDHPDYSNKCKRNLAYDLLLPILRTFTPTANRYNVRQKINILRSTFRKELRKYQASRTITENGEIIYTHMPPSWKFAALKFLEDWNSISDNGEISEISQSEIVIEETIEDDAFNELEEQELVFIQDPETESGNEEHEMIQNPISPSFHEEKDLKPIIIKNARKRKTICNNDALMMNRECTAVGSNVTCKLQRMNIDQRFYAEQLINKVLMRGLRNTLTDTTEFTDAIMRLTKIESLADSSEIPSQ